MKKYYIFLLSWKYNFKKFYEYNFEIIGNLYPAKQNIVKEQVTQNLAIFNVKKQCSTHQNVGILETDIS